MGEARSPPEEKPGLQDFPAELRGLAGGSAWRPRLHASGLLGPVQPRVAWHRPASAEQSLAIFRACQWLPSNSALLMASCRMSNTLGGNVPVHVKNANLPKERLTSN